MIYWTCIYCDVEWGEDYDAKIIRCPKCGQEWDVRDRDDIIEID